MNFTKEDTNKAKGIAILLLCFHHLFYQPNFYTIYNFKTILPAETVSFLASQARVCVWIFAFLSAYGLTCQYLKYEREQAESIHVFMFKRWFSLMSFYWFAYLTRLIITAATRHTVWETYEHHVLYILLDAMGWADFFSTPMLAGVNWYMCLAQVIILLVPLLTALCRKLGWAVIPAAFLALPLLGNIVVSACGGDYANYMMVIVFGVFFACYDVFGRIRRWPGIKGFVELLVLLLGTVAAMYIRWRLLNTDAFDTNGLPNLMSAVAAVLIILLSYLYIVRLPGKILQYLGRHSGNMFIIHTLFRDVWGQYFMTLTYPVCIWAAVAAASLLCSMLMEYIKKVSGYNRAGTYLIQKVQRASLTRTI